MLAITYLFSIQVQYQPNTKLDCIDLLLVLLRSSTRLCVLLYYMVFRNAGDY